MIIFLKVYQSPDVKEGRKIMQPDISELEQLVSDQEAFEIRRKEIIEKFIQSSPECYQPKLRKLQETIDHLRQTLPTDDFLRKMIRLATFNVQTQSEQINRLLKELGLSEGILENVNEH